MSTPLSDSSQTPQESVDLAIEQLELVSEQLEAEQKTLRRDWNQLQPRERSEQSRRVKELEVQQQTLLDDIEMNRLI